MESLLVATSVIAVVIPLMIQIRHISVFVAWLACLGATFVGVTNFPAPFGEIAVFSVWSLYLIFAMFAFLMAAHTKNPRRQLWLGIAVFSIGSIIIFSVADAYNTRTVGTILADVLLGSSPIQPPAINSDLQPPLKLTADTHNKWLLWENHSNAITDLVDLAAASCLTMTGAYAGAFLGRKMAG